MHHLFIKIAHYAVLLAALAVHAPVASASHQLSTDTTAILNRLANSPDHSRLFETLQSMLNGHEASFTTDVADLALTYAAFCNNTQDRITNDYSACSQDEYYIRRAISFYSGHPEQYHQELIRAQYILAERMLLFISKRLTDSASVFVDLLANLEIHRFESNFVPRPFLIIPPKYFYRGLPDKDLVTKSYLIVLSLAGNYEKAKTVFDMLSPKSQEDAASRLDTAEVYFRIRRLEFQKARDIVLRNILPRSDGRYMGQKYLADIFVAEGLLEKAHTQYLSIYANQLGIEVQSDEFTFLDFQRAYKRHAGHFDPTWFATHYEILIALERPQDALWLSTQLFLKKRAFRSDDEVTWRGKGGSEELFGLLKSVELKLQVAGIMPDAQTLEILNEFELRSPGNTIEHADILSLRAKILTHLGRGMSRLMLKSAKRASPVINLCGFGGLGKMAVQ